MKRLAVLGSVIVAAVPLLGYAVTPSRTGDGATYELPLTSMDIAGLTLLASTFEDAESVFGRARPQTESSGLETVTRLCYASAHAGDHTRLELKSYGKGKYLTHYTLLTALKPGPCVPSLKLGIGLTAVDDRLRLGMSKDQVVAAIGEPRVRNLDAWPAGDLPNQKHPNTWTYMVTWREPFSQVDSKAIAELLDGSDADAHRYAWTQVMLRFRDSKLVRIDVDHGVGY